MFESDTRSVILADDDDHEDDMDSDNGISVAVAVPPTCRESPRKAHYVYYLKQ